MSPVQLCIWSTHLKYRAEGQVSISYNWVVTMWLFLSGTRWCKKPLGWCTAGPHERSVAAEVPAPGAPGGGLWPPQAMLSTHPSASCSPQQETDDASKKSEIVPRWEAASPNFAKCSGGGLALQKDGQFQGILCKAGPAPRAWKGIPGWGWWSPSWTPLVQETLLSTNGSEITHRSETPNSLSAVTWREEISFLPAPGCFLKAFRFRKSRFLGMGVYMSSLEPPSE